MKVVINKCWGGFGLNGLGLAEYNKRRVADGKEPVTSDDKIERDDPDLVSVVEEIGEKSFGEYGKLKVVEIPDGVNWHIEQYGGMEHVAEDHRTWGAEVRVIFSQKT